MNDAVEGTAISEMVSQLALTTTRGNVRLADFRGHHLVLYFYPKDDTPGCTIEGQDFSRRHQDFLKADTQVVGVSRDSVASHDRFVRKHGLTITLISDGNEHLCNAFGVIKEKNMYGKTVMGIERSTFLIHADGVLIKAWRGVKVPGHVEEVLAAARGLNA
jgi:peroxiredoxin Q/BCP